MDPQPSMSISCISSESVLTSWRSTGSYKQNTVTITHNLNAQDNGGNDACATLRAHSAHFNLYNVNVANTYGAGKQATAVAVRHSVIIPLGDILTSSLDYRFLPRLLWLQVYGIPSMLLLFREWQHYIDVLLRTPSLQTAPIRCNTSATPTLLVQLITYMATPRHGLENVLSYLLAVVL